jgi:hypothetical protein
LLSGLPRFDDKGALLPPTDWRRSFGDADPGPAFEAADSSARDTFIEEAPLSELPLQPPPPAQLDLATLEASLAALNGKLEKIERDARAQAVENIRSMAAKLFPLMSKAFLAEEIGRHLPALVPASAAVVEIYAEESLASALRDMVERNNSLAHRCTILPASAPGQGRIDVSWQTGGLTFDFDGLLQACLAQLNSTQTMTKE